MYHSVTYASLTKIKTYNCIVITVQVVKYLSAKFYHWENVIVQYTFDRNWRPFTAFILSKNVRIVAD